MTSTTSSLGRVLKYLWDSEPSPSAEGALWVLGHEYTPDEEGWPQAFLDDVASRIWLMYRTNFALIPRHPDGPSPIQIGSFLRGGAIDSNGFVSDVGWGCMIRTGQSLLANALVSLRLGRIWRYSGKVEPDERTILELFYDQPSAPYSIHNFVSHGAAFGGKLPGQWFGPSTVASGIRALSDSNGSELQIYVSDGMDVYEDELVGLATSLAKPLQINKDAEVPQPSRTDRWRPVLVLCGIRLGISEVNPVYYDGIRAALQAPQSVGIAGGRTSASHYFYGFQGDRLFYHDPHLAKQALVNIGEPGMSPELDSVHSRQLHALNLSDMDPSMLVGFLLQSRNDFEDWKVRMKSVLPSQRIVSVQDTRPVAPLDNGDELDLEGDEGELESSTTDLGPETGSPMISSTREEGFIVCELPSKSEEGDKLATRQVAAVDDIQEGGDPKVNTETEGEVVISAPNVADETSVVVDIPPTPPSGDAKTSELLSVPSISSTEVEEAPPTL